MDGAAGGKVRPRRASCYGITMRWTKTHIPTAVQKASHNQPSLKEDDKDDDDDDIVLFPVIRKNAFDESVVLCFTSMWSQSEVDMKLSKMTLTMSFFLGFPSG